MLSTRTYSRHVHLPAVCAKPTRRLPSVYACAESVLRSLACKRPTYCTSAAALKPAQPPGVHVTTPNACCGGTPGSRVPAGTSTDGDPVEKPSLKVASSHE